MISKITITCPCCSQVSDIFLSTHSPIVLLNCPTCWAAVMYYDEDVFVLSDSQVEEIKKAGGGPKLNKLLERIVQSKVAVTSGAHRTLHHTAVSHSLPAQVRNSRLISHDDIVNLQIELAICRDCSEFFAKI